MTAANVQATWVSGDLNFLDASGNIIATLDGTNRELEIPTGSALVVGGSTLSPAELAVLDVVAGTATADKAVVLDASKGIATITSATITTLTSTTGNIATVNATNIDAGASGTAGTVDIFPTTASKGKTALSASDNVGDTTTSIFTASMAGARSIRITDPVDANSSIHPVALFVDGADGAVTAKSGFVFLTKAGVEADTLAAPTVTTDDGKVLTFVATTANAHTVTQASPGFNNGGGGADVATFGGAVGDNFSVVAYQGVWYVLNAVNVTIA